ncbi:peptidoglycan DD-metalloendopeptidase family protein [Psychrobacter arenosus]|uniref:peptidoglycan DD-metalloendopeptidase family protein n=1 Tax=Psychrobacter arenosus TaxID=256326 RepID=UPI00191A3FBD|nr:peptidoglycan DD-metalloendopeptidase family protein [Psychrobacter arenosus]
MNTKTTWQQWRPLAAVAILALGAVGCATKPTYQAGGSAGPTIVANAQGVPNFYRVQRGDTVSQIAARYGMNYRHIGAINGLDSQYTIYSGQWLKLWEGGNTQARPAANTGYQTNTRPQQPTAPAPKPSSPVYGTTATDTQGYVYPTSNQVIRNFDEQSGVMGMWFAGREGDPVVASQSGVVLYSGNGLPEYGNLIMVRHGESYITAYAHNSQLLVKEGDQVQRGQRIATMGRTGQTDQVGLEFQVRQNGNPIDPRALLGR